MPTLSAPDAPVAEWLEAARVRHSRRSYDGTTIAEETMAALDDFCRHFLPAPVARAQLIRSAPADIFTGIVGGYGRVTGAPSAVAFTGTKGAPGVEMAVGYTGEAFVLEATRLGLGTCWIGGFFKPGRVTGILEMAGGEQVFAVSPVGTPSEALTGFEKVVKTVKTTGGATPRKPAEEIAPGCHSWVPWARAGVDAARIAPSAANRQPWRFRYEDGRVVVSFDGQEIAQKVSKKVDCGIAMLHFELGARLAGVTGEWQRIDRGADVAMFVLG